MEKIIEIPEGYEARIEGNKVVFEPKESEDERIRKHIIKILDRLAPCHWDGNEKAKCIAYLEEQKEQKPTGWSEEDEKKLSTVISLMKSSRAVDPFYDKMCLKDWLNSLPKRFDLQPKQEDRYIEGYQKGFADAEKVYNNGVPYYIGNPNIYKLDPNVVIDSTTGGTYVACHCWKPSEEQMEWLESAVKLSTDKPGIHGIILSLYEQLKRL